MLEESSPLSCWASLLSGLRLRNHGRSHTIKITAIIPAVLLAPTAAYSEDMIPVPRSVIVCMEPAFGAGHAQKIASELFARIDVTVRWRHGLRDCPPQGIMVTLSQATPIAFRLGALAFTFPYEGTDINVLYDRICERRDPLLILRLLAYVLVHEIAHILQGVPHHSDHGIMKARWEEDDFKDIARGKLEFDTNDVDRIQLGLATRATRAMAATKATPVVLSAR